MCNACIYIYISHVIGTKQVYIYIYLYTIGCCFQSMTKSTSHGCFPGTPWGDKKYPCRFTVKKTIQVRDCWAHHVSCISILHVFTFSGSKEEATFSEKFSVIPSSHASFVHSKAKTKATHVWQADLSNNLAPLTDYIWRGEGRAFCNKMPDRIQVKNNEQLGNVETMFFQRQVCVSFCSMYKYVYLRTQQALHSATNVSSRNIACLTNCFIFWRGMAIPRNRCCLKWTKTCSGTLAWTTHPKKTRNQRTQMQITWQKKAESRKV